MNGVTLLLRTLHHGEERLAEHLTEVAERHRAEHEVHYVATDLALWSREHARRLAGTGRLHAPDPGASDTGLPASLRGKAAQAGEHRTEPGLLLLRDLRDLRLAAAENSLNREMPAQAAQATRDGRLLALASSCHPRTLRQMRWSNTMLKNLCPQILTSL